MPHLQHLYQNNRILQKKKSMIEKAERAQVRIDKKLKDAAKARAAERGETLEKYLNGIVAAAVNENKAP